MRAQATNQRTHAPPRELGPRFPGGEDMSRRHWLATYGGKIPCEIDPDAHDSVLEMLEHAMQRFAERPAFRCFGQSLTCGAAYRVSRQWAAYWQGHLGVQYVDCAGLRVR